MSLEPDSLAKLPATAGVYLMKDAAGKIIYIGKAANLRSRVRSYFREGGDGRLQSEFLRGRIDSIETILTTNEKEALLLENTLIKKHKPRYNMRLRDDKTYISLRLDTSHEWPRLHRSRRRRPGDKAYYFGPYSSSKAVNESIRFLQRLFPLRSCTDHELGNRSRPCILHQIDRCSAPCVGLVSKEQYAGFVRQTIEFLRGRPHEVVGLLTRRMEEFSEKLEFEKAAIVRDRLRSMESVLEEEKVHSHRRFDRDVIAMTRRGGRLSFSVLHFRGGRMDETRTHGFVDHGIEEGQVIEEFLSQFYSAAPAIPRDILVPSAPANAEMLRAALEAQRAGPVRLHVPMRGEKRRLLEMARQNAEAALDRMLSGEKTIEETLENLRAALRLASLPRHIVCVDVSTFQGAASVASLVSFRDGQPDKTGYRRFKIRTIEGQDDFAMMREVLCRHFIKTRDGREELPDLLIVDGGKGQLAVAVDVLRELDLVERLPVAGLAKSRLKPARGEPEKKQRTEERIFLPLRKNPVVFGHSEPALHLLERLRDEAHRFAITFNRQLRAKRALLTGLEEIPGVGPMRRRALLKRFGTLAQLREATLEQLKETDGVPEAVAEQVFRFLQPPAVTPEPEQE
ncbi:excinuclease ABC subunit UvrC [Candidatus Poribacteria bacterium]|nr:excinuclease ABC subunit UvrC [Candidatus Poribacteria bacterium]